MHLFCSRIGRAAAVAAALLALPGAQAQKWTDRAEYDLVFTIRSEALPASRLALIDQWKQKYPKTEMAQVRAELDLYTSQALGMWDRMRGAARDLLAGNRENFVGLYWTTLLAPGAKEASPAELTAAEGAAKQLLAGLDTYFAAAAMPAGATAAEWRQRRIEAEVLAHRTLGWIEWQRGSFTTAEQEFTTCLEKIPQDARASAWLGTVLALEKTTEKQTSALWHLAHAAFSDGEGSLSGTQRQEVNGLLEKFYTAFHGSAEGLPELGASAKTAPFPPAGFRVETAAAAGARKQEEELTRTNPELAAWVTIRKRLDAPDGDKYFAEYWQDRALPALKGKVVECLPPARPKTIVLSMAESAGAEVRLTLDRPFANGAEAGTELRFEGTGVSFTREPFLLNIRAEQDKIAGWPAAGGSRR